MDGEDSLLALDSLETPPAAPSSSVVSSQGLQINIFCLLWSINLPRKILIFIWRLLRGILPTKGMLHYRHISSVGCCPQCGQANESLMHTFRRCPFASEVWIRLGFGFSFLDSNSNDSFSS